MMALGSPRVHTREQTEKRPAVKQQIKGCRYWKLARRGRAACSDPPKTDPLATQAHAIPEDGASQWGADDEVVPAENAPQPPYSWGRSRRRGGQRAADNRDLAGRKKIRRRTTASPGAYVKAGAANN